MINKTNSLVTLAVILAVLGVSKPAKAIVRDRSDAESATFSVSDESLAAQPRIDKATDNNSRVTVSQVDVNLDTVRNNNPVNADLEDSGSIDSGLEDSGAVNSDLEDSGSINSDLEGSGSINSDLESSGEVDFNFRDSGAVNSDLEDSGKPFSTDDLDLEDETTISDREIVAPNDAVEGETPGTEIAEKKGSWWWLIPLLGIPLLALIIALNGRKKSDREPAIGNIANPDAPDDGGLTPVGSDLSGNLNNVSGNAATATSRRGGTVARGATAANLVGNRPRTRTEEPNLDLDLEPTDTVAEIPSDSVSEFTGQESKLVSDRPKNLQTKSDRDLDPLDFEFSDSTAQRDVAVGLGGVAASESLAERETTPLTDEDDAVSPESNTAISDIIERNEADRIDSTKTTAAKEFRGDYVLQEETNTPFTSELNVAPATNIETTNVSERSPEPKAMSTTSSAIAESDTTTDIDLDLDEAATSEFSNQQLRQDRSPVDEYTLAEADNVIDLRQSEQDNPSETAEAASATRDLDLSLDDDDDSVTNYATQGGIALGSATASGIFDREKLPAQQNIEQSEFSELDDVPAETNRDASDLNNVQAAPELLRATLNREAIDGVDFSLEEITFDNPDSIDLSRDEITSDNSDRPSDTSIDERTFGESDSSIDLGIEEITFDESDSSIDSIVDSDDDISSVSFEERTFDESESSIDSIIDNDDDASSVSIKEITFDELKNSSDLNLDDITFDKSDRSSDTNLDEITFDESDSSTDLNLDEITSDDSDRSSDTNLDKITFDESDSSTDSIIDSDDDISSVSFEEITFDESENSPDLNLDDITFDESESSIDSIVDSDDDISSVSFEEITFDELENSPDLNLDDITFDESESSTDLNLDDITFDESDRPSDTSLDEITFDESESSTDLNLDDITFDESDRPSDSSLEEITFDESPDASDSFSDNLDTTGNDRMNLDDLGFEESESKDDSSFDLLSDNTADIASLSDENFEDMDNISQWLDSLQTPRQDSDTDNISEWLDTLDTDDLDSAEKDSNSDNTMELNEESEDVSFQFLEDLLERDSNPNDEKR